jgi:hypothetical protein
MGGMMRTVQVSKCLDKKLLMFGYEIPDVLAIFLTLSILNFLFGETSMKLLMIWLPTVLLALVLRYGKRGKPDKYLVHWLRFQIRPGHYCAFKRATMDVPPPSIKGDKNVHPAC